MGFLIHEDVVHHRIPLETNLQAIAIQARLHKQVTICNVYINPKQNITLKDLENLTKQLPKPFIITGDFNSHHTLWYGREPNARGKILADFILENDNINIIDKNEHTYEEHRNDGSIYTSHIDLTLVTPDLQPDLNWTTLDDNGGSDHIPILIEINKSYDFSTYTKWNLKKANWEKYRNLAIFDIPIVDFSDIQELTDYIVKTINSAADKAIGKIKIEKGKSPKPWWNVECKTVIKNKKKLYRKYKRNKTLSNLIEYKKANAIVVRTVRKSKQESWNKFLASINLQTSVKDVWRKINAVKGQNKIKSISSIKLGENSIIDSKSDIANALGEKFQNNSDGKNSRDSFKKYRDGREKENKIDFTSDTTEVYNLPITIQELKDILKTSGNTSPGEDAIPYEMIKQLSDNSLIYILNFYNILFKNHLFPSDWKEAIIIPILKSGKNPLDCGSYRPIALISCLSKILDKIINKRLMWYLETNNYINKSQCGYRPGRNTDDHTTRLTSDIQEAIVDNQYHISVFLDLEKAYESCWKQVILDQLQKFNIKGNLAFYIQNFLLYRSIKVKVGNEYSKNFLLDLGIPQGSSISTTLFIIAINTVTDFMDKDTQLSLFVDDFRFSLKAPSLGQNTKNKLQSILDRLQIWESKTGFKFAKGKSEVLICTRKIGDLPTIDLKLDGEKLKVVQEKLFLGVWFHWRLSWKTHLEYIKVKCLRAMRVLQTIAYSKSKTDTKMLLRIYKTLILPKLDYGCLAYGTGSQTQLKQLLDPIHHKALRICLGAFHTTRTESLYVETNLHSLFYRRKILSIKYYARTQKIDKDKTVCNLHDKRRDKLFENSKRFETLGMKIRTDMKQLNIKFPPILTQSVSKVPPWIIPKINICLELEKFPKKITPTRQLISEFLHHKHKTDIDIYTDGSKTTAGVGAGIAIRTSSNLSNNLFSKSSKPLSSKASILSAELQAISWGLQTMAKLCNKSCTVYSDSKGALQSIMQYNPKNPLVQEIQAKINKAFSHNNKIIFCWIPSHCDIPGNECADKLAKQASKSPTSPLHFVLARDLNSYINDKGKKWLQKYWDTEDRNKLQFIDKKIGPKEFPSFNTRLDEIKYNRIRLGHSRLTNKHLAAGENPPICIICEIPVTI